MAKMPDGWVMIPKYEGINQDENGKLVQQFSIEDKELVMCKNCKWWDKDHTTDGVKGFCPNTGCCEQPDFYCADGERRDSE